MRRRILFVGGETGGHLYPALALAEELAGRGEVDPVFLTSGGPLATRILEPHGVRTMIGESPSTRRPLAIGTSGRRLVRILDRERIDAVVALGGRPGVIPGLWARWRRRPLFLLEQNRVLGRAHRALLPLATRIFLSFDDTSPEERLRDRALRLGCPVRPSFVPSPPPVTDSPVLLVLGGSQGALDINELAPEALARTRSDRPWRILHICGPDKEKGIAAQYRASGLLATVRPFLQDPASALREADLVLARAGGSTVAELTAVGRGSLLIPYPHHRDRQQFLNAEALVERGGAEVVPLAADAVAARLDAHADDPGLLASRARGAATLGRPDAAARIADVIATHLDCDPRRRTDARGRDATPRSPTTPRSSAASSSTPGAVAASPPGGEGPR